MKPETINASLKTWLNPLTTIPQVYLKARRKIKAGEEILTHYGRNYGKVNDIIFS